MFATPDDRSAGRPAAQLAIAADNGRWDDTGWCVRRDGQRLWTEIAISAFRPQGGPELAYSVVLRNLTERRRAEEALRQSEERLRRVQRLDAVGRLAAGLAHDFNNLLNIITTHSGLMRQELPADSPHRDATRQIEETALRTAGLTRQLLAFGRRQVLESNVLDLNSVVADLHRLFRGLLRHGIELNFTLGPGLWPVKADRGQLEQVLINLAVNARDAMARGGTITISLANVSISSSLDGSPGGSPDDVPPGDYACLTVSDTGCGIDAATRAHLFEPFFTTKEPGKGTGLGLATVYGIVTQSGGHIAVDSVVGAGTTFRIYLPRHLDSPPGQS